MDQETFLAPSSDRPTYRFWYFVNKSQAIISFLYQRFSDVFQGVWKGTSAWYCLDVFVLLQASEWIHQCRTFIAYAVLLLQFYCKRRKLKNGITLPTLEKECKGGRGTEWTTLHPWTKFFNISSTTRLGINSLNFGVFGKPFLETYLRPQV